jgi:dihydropteroate synthase
MPGRSSSALKGLGSFSTQGEIPEGAPSRSPVGLNPAPSIPLPCGTTLHPSLRALIMGVINTTPDSFSDGGVHETYEAAVSSALEMFREGADIVDVGGESTRPGSSPVSPDVEWGRTVPVIKAIIRENPDAVISVDTRRSQIARAAMEAGAQIINDVSGFRDDPGTAQCAVETQAALVVMHMLGRPKDMQRTIRYREFPGDIHAFFRERIDSLEAAGVDPRKIVLDPGIGFGKTFEQNLILINRLHEFLRLGKHILLGPSRKAFLGKILDEPVPSRRDGGTCAVVVAAILRGASILRVHDVPSAVRACKVAEAVLRERTDP